MAKGKKEKAKGKGSKKSKESFLQSKKMKIIVIAVVAVVVIAILAFLFLGGDDDGNGGNGEENHPPVGEIILTQNDFFVNRVIYFNSTSSDLDDDTLEYLWNFDDGETSSKANATHTYTLAGTYNVTFTVTDEHDEKDVDSKTIEVKEVPETTMSVDRAQPLPSQPPTYTVTIETIEQTISAALVHLYVIDGNTQEVLVEGRVSDFVPPHEYVKYYDTTPQGNLSAGDYFIVTDFGSLSPKGIDDGDLFRLVMEESLDPIGEITLQ